MASKGRPELGGRGLLRFRGDDFIRILRGGGVTFGLSLERHSIGISLSVKELLSDLHVIPGVGGERARLCCGVGVKGFSRGFGLRVARKQLVIAWHVTHLRDPE